MTIRVRQVCFVAKKLAPVVEHRCRLPAAAWPARLVPVFLIDHVPDHLRRNARFEQGVRILRLAQAVRSTRGVVVHEAVE